MAPRFSRNCTASSESFDLPLCALDLLQLRFPSRLTPSTRSVHSKEIEMRSIAPDGDGHHAGPVIPVLY